MNVSEYKELTKGSRLERLLAAQILWANLPPPEREFKLFADRKYRGDFVWPKSRLCVELQGGCHTIRARWLQDIDKSQHLLLAGWRLLYLSPEDVKKGRAVDLIFHVLNMCE
jgi:very-short-patch-repair endonuclease